MSPSLDQAKELDNARRSASNLGLPITFTDSDSPIHKQGAADAETEGTRRESEAYVFFPKGGGEPRIVVNVDRCKTWDTVYQKILHEGAGHYGLQKLFGEDLDTVLDNIWNAATPDLQQRISTRYGDYKKVYTTAPDTGKTVLDEAATRREAVNEYMSRLAEKTGEFTPQERTFWETIKNYFLRLLRSKGFRLKRLTDDDLRNIIRESRRNLERTEQQRRQADPTAPTDRTQVLRTAEPGPDSPAGQTPAEGVDRYGTRVNKRMADISDKLAGMEMDENQRKVVSVFTGASDNEPISIQRTDGKNVRLILRQGNENRSGSKHSLFRHYGTNSSPYSAKDILSITKTVEKGTRKRKNNNKSIEYRWDDETGSTYFVITDIKNGREEFANFYKTEKVSPTARETPSNQARAVVGDTSSTGKDTQNSPTDQTNSQKSATEQGKNFYSLPLQPANDPALTPEQASLLSPENLLKAGENAVLDINSTNEALPLLSVAGEDGARLTSYGRLNERRRKEGLQLDFDIQGNLVGYGLYHNGRREGMHYTFNAFGEKLSEGEFRNGTPVGTHRLWRDYDMISGHNGKDYRTDKHPYLVVNYNEQGKRQGDSWRYDENGKPMTRSIWNNGRRVAEWYDKGYIQQVVNHPEEYDTNADAALWRRRMARKHGSTPWIPLGQPGAGQPYKPAEQTGTDSYSLPEDRTLPEEPGYPLRDFVTDPLAHVRDNLSRVAEREEGDRPLDWTDPYEAFRRPRTAALELSQMTDASSSTAHAQLKPAPTTGTSSTTSTTDATDRSTPTSPTTTATYSTSHSPPSTTHTPCSQQPTSTSTTEATHDPSEPSSSHSDTHSRTTSTERSRPGRSRARHHPLLKAHGGPSKEKRRS